MLEDIKADGRVKMESRIITPSERKVTLEEVEKLEHELSVAKSDLMDLKELIIKILFDKYGF